MSVVIFTSGQMAEKIGVTRQHLQYLIETGRVPGPSLHVPGRRLFTSDDEHNIVAALAARRQRQRQLTRNRRTGLQVGSDQTRDN